MTTDSARIHTWGCDRHTENTYEGCASCDLEDFSELSSKLSTANARIAELEKGLRDLCRAYVNLMESGRERILFLGGDCDPVDVMERGDPYLRQARSLMER